eukprot:415738_1
MIITFSFSKNCIMGNDVSHIGWHRRGTRFGSNQFHAMYGGRRRRPVTLSSRSSGQVEEAKNQFDHFVFETDFDFMPRSAKLRKEIFGHMTKDARNAVRQYVDSMNAKVLFRSQNKNRHRGQNRVFKGSVTITPSTREYMIEQNKLREVDVVSELALCSFLCFAGIPHTVAKGWIVDDVQQNEFEAIEDIKQYLTKKALIWKKPIHCTDYVEFQGKKPKDLKQKLKDRELGRVTCGKENIKPKSRGQKRNRSLQDMWGNTNSSKRSKLS